MVSSWDPDAVEQTTTAAVGTQTTEEAVTACVQVLRVVVEPAPVRHALVRQCPSGTLTSRTNAKRRLKSIHHSDQSWSSEDS